jgi:hypothetical protein
MSMLTVRRRGNAHGLTVHVPVTHVTRAGTVYAMTQIPMPLGDYCREVMNTQPWAMADGRLLTQAHSGSGSGSDSDMDMDVEAEIPVTQTQLYQPTSPSYSPITPPYAQQDPVSPSYLPISPNADPDSPRYYPCSQEEQEDLPSRPYVHQHIPLSPRPLSYYQGAMSLFDECSQCDEEEEEEETEEYIDLTCEEGDSMMSPIICV